MQSNADPRWTATPEMCTRIGSGIGTPRCEPVQYTLSSRPGRFSSAAFPSCTMLRQDDHGIYAWAQDDETEPFGPYSDARARVRWRREMQR